MSVVVTVKQITDMMSLIVPNINHGQAYHKTAALGMTETTTSPHRNTTFIPDSRHYGTTCHYQTEYIN